MTNSFILFYSEKPDRKGNVARPFLCCIIDDASLCTEPQTLIPLALGMNKLILVGDIELLPLNLNSSVFPFILFFHLHKT